MSETLIGYARCSTDEQDPTAQRQRLAELGVADERIYLDHGLTGTNRKRPGLDQALAAVREGDTHVVPKLDRLARSVPDAREIGDSLAARGIKLSLGGQVYDPADPMDKMFRGIHLSAAQVYRLVSGTPERLSLPILVALCDILSCTPNDLIVPHVETATKPRKAAGGDLPDDVLDLNRLGRPRRARITPESQ